MTVEDSFPAVGHEPALRKQPRRRPPQFTIRWALGMMALFAALAWIAQQGFFAGLLCLCLTVSIAACLFDRRRGGSGVLSAALGGAVGTWIAVLAAIAFFYASTAAGQVDSRGDESLLVRGLLFVMLFYGFAGFLAGSLVGITICSMAKVLDEAGVRERRVRSAECGVKTNAECGMRNEDKCGVRNVTCEN